MRTRPLALALVGFSSLSLLAACGGKVVVDDGQSSAGGSASTGSGSTGGSSSSSISCETPAGTTHACITLMATSGVTSALCASVGDSVVPSCPSGIGTCTITESAEGQTASEIETFYSDSGATASSLEQQCSEAGGEWTSQ